MSFFRQTAATQKKVAELAARKPPVLLPQQADAREAYLALAPQSALVIDARPGTGKTTLVDACIRALGRDWYYSTWAMAFQRSNKDDLTKKLPNEVHVKTLDALAFAMLTRVKVYFEEDNESFGYAFNIANGEGGFGPDWKLMESLEIPRQWRRRVYETMAIFRATAVPYEVLAGKNIPLAKLVELLDEHGVKVPTHVKQQATLVRYAMDCFKKIDETFKSSFDPEDKMWLSISDVPWLSLRYGKWDEHVISHVVVDEAQDVNRVQAHAVARLLRENKGPDGKPPRLLIVGDPHQAINGFRAAGKGDLDYVINDIRDINGWTAESFPSRRMPLTVSMRCPKSHTEYARKYAEVYSHPDAAEGVITGPDRIFDLGTIARGATILSRYNAPLTLLAITLLNKGRAVHFPGGEELSRAGAMLSEFLGHVAMKYQDQGTKEHVKTHLLSRLGDLQAVAPGERRRADSVEIERIKVALALLDGLPSKATAQDVDALLMRMASNDPGAIKLLSVHRAKGLEWDSVYILDHDLHLEDEAKLAKMPVWLQAQERNCSFVAITRSKYAITLFTTEAWTRAESAKIAARHAEAPAIIEDDDGELL